MCMSLFIIFRKIEEMMHVREEQKIQLDTIWLKLQSQAEKEQYERLLSSNSSV